MKSSNTLPFYDINLCEKVILNFQMASCTQWDKLSPNEFQQLQDLASCKYFFCAKNFQHTMNIFI